jgi:hypothetical protein
MCVSLLEITAIRATRLFASAALRAACRLPSSPYGAPRRLPRRLPYGAPRRLPRIAVFFTALRAACDRPAALRAAFSRVRRFAPPPSYSTRGLRPHYIKINFPLRGKLY